MNTGRCCHACVHAGTVPLGVKPVLVFINTKSGPQKGWKLRRKFLRLLNPLQVPCNPISRRVNAWGAMVLVAVHTRTSPNFLCASTVQNGLPAFLIVPIYTYGQHSDDVSPCAGLVLPPKMLHNSCCQASAQQFLCSPNICSELSFAAANTGRGVATGAARPGAGAVLGRPGSAHPGSRRRWHRRLDPVVLGPHRAAEGRASRHRLAATANRHPASRHRSILHHINSDRLDL